MNEEEIIFTYPNISVSILSSNMGFDRNRCWIDMIKDGHPRSICYYFDQEFPSYHRFDGYCDEKLYEQIKSDILKLMELKAFI